MLQNSDTASAFGRAAKPSRVWPTSFILNEHFKRQKKATTLLKQAHTRQTLQTHTVIRLPRMRHVVMSSKNLGLTGVTRPHTHVPTLIFVLQPCHRTLNQVLQVIQLATRQKPAVVCCHAAQRTRSCTFNCTDNIQKRVDALV